MARRTWIAIYRDVFFDEDLRRFSVTERFLFERYLVLARWDGSYRGYLVDEDGKPYGVREIAERCGIVHSTVVKANKKLIDAKLIIRNKHGRLKIANYERYVWVKNGFPEANGDAGSGQNDSEKRSGNASSPEGGVSHTNGSSGTTEDSQDGASDTSGVSGTTLGSSGTSKVSSSNGSSETSGSSGTKKRSVTPGSTTLQGNTGGSSGTESGSSGTASGSSETKMVPQEPEPRSNSLPIRIRREMTQEEGGTGEETNCSETDTCVAAAPAGLSSSEGKGIPWLQQPWTKDKAQEFHHTGIITIWAKVAKPDLDNDGAKECSRLISELAEKLGRHWHEGHAYTAAVRVMDERKADPPAFARLLEQIAEALSPGDQTQEQEESHG